jgi:hypothetical protein
VQPNSRLLRLLGVHRKLKTALAVAAIAAVSGCGAFGPGSPKACPAIGAQAGIGLDIAPGYAAKVGNAKLKTCWGSACKDQTIELYPSSSASALPCTGTGPDAACGAQAVPTGGKNGFFMLPDMPVDPLDATLTLTDAAGAPITEQTLRLSPKITYPAGPDCGGGVPQTGLQVSPDGTVSERP